MHAIEKLTSLEYNAVMIAINNYRAELMADGLACYPDMVLDNVENIIMTSNVPL
jgi:hypothetical protein